jgi:predicted transcriptional regulator
MLLHLRRNDPDALLKDSDRRAFTQPGIAKELGASRGTTSDLLRVFTDEGLVIQGRTVVGGQGATPYTYILTDKGRAAAKLVALLEEQS